MANLVFISAAHVHTGGFIDEIRRNPDGRRVHAVWDDHTERGQRFAAHAGAPFVASLDAVLADPAVDGFIIAAENTRHLAFLQRVLPVGKPVFCEKPLLPSTEEIASLRALLAAHPTPLVCGYFHPFATDLQSAAALLKTSALGRVTRATFRNAHHGAYSRWFDDPHVAWIRKPHLAAGGGFLDLGTHAIHQLLTLFGRVTSAWADIRNEARIYPDVDDCGVAHLRFASGVFATVEAGWTQSAGVNGLEVVGVARTLWNTSAGYVTGAPNEIPQPLPLTHPAAPACIDRLVATIRGKISAATLRAEVATAIDAVAVMAACYRSAESGHWTEISYPDTP
ncbi:Gfo/Idh/MocA family protein [Oleiharenicola lentus]|uniref:Gfo/Idh/MocA family protein n=1 Tax=Oleiharenicola lentus TaxID=2508720 RepID=UPI003F6817A5